MTEMTFNGVDMSRFFRITDIIRPIGNKRIVSTDDAPLLGVNIQQVKRGEKEHTIKFDMKNADTRELEQLKHELAGVLDVLEPVRIVYGDEPDKYYLGIPVDEVTPENLTRWFQRSEMKILIPDGVAHSSTMRRIDSQTATVSSDKLTFTVNNKGTVAAHPIITVKHNAENGYIGLVNASGAFELGNRQEVDGETVRQSELLLDYRNNLWSDGLRAGVPNAAILNDTTQALNGRVGSYDFNGRKFLFLSNWSTSGGNSAGSLTWDIPADSNGEKGSLNDYIWWRQIFWMGAINQLGFIKLTVSDTNGQFLYGVETYKRAYGLDCEYNFLASDGKGGYNILKRWTFQGTHLDTQNPFNEPRGWSDLKRNDDKVQVYWWGSYPTFTIPEIKGRRSAKIHLAFGTVRNNPLITRMYVEQLYYQKDFVQTTRDIPNRYPMGSQVVINSDEDTVLVDGLARIGDVVDGSSWLTLPPGQSQLELYVSSFVKKKPTVSIEFQERWL